MRFAVREIKGELGLNTGLKAAPKTLTTASGFRANLRERGKSSGCQTTKGTQKGTEGRSSRSGAPSSVLFLGRVKVWLLLRFVVHLRGRRPGVFWGLGSGWPGVVRPGRLRGVGAGGLRGPDCSPSLRQASPGTVGARRWRVFKERGWPWPGVTRDGGTLRQSWGALLLSGLCGLGRGVVPDA